MSRPYLDLCKDLVSELGVAGGTGPSSVTGQTGELKNMVRWVAEADLYVQNLWVDWQFLWTEVSGQVVTEGNDTITYVTDLETPVINGLVMNDGLGTAYRPQYMEWDHFRARYGTKPKSLSARVARWTMRPDRVIALSNIMSADVAWRLEYYKRPAKLTTNVSRSPIPERFERIILARAAIMYGTREDAPEILTGYAAEYADTLEKMETFFVPNQKPHGTGNGASMPEPDWSGAS